MFGLSSLRLGIYAVCAVAIIAGLFKLHDSIGDTREAKVRAEYDVIAEKQQRENQQKEADDAKAKEETKREYQAEIDRLNSDHRIASLKCLRNAPRPREVPRETATGPGAATEARAESTPAVTFDPGPRIDELTREADKALAQCNALIDWVLQTR